MIHHHQAYHNEYINHRRPNPRLFCVGDHVFANRFVKSIKKRVIVGELMESYTGPWKITGKIKGSSYALEYRETKKIGKHHAAHLYTYPQ